MTLDLDAIAREAGLVVNVSTDPNSPPSWWACGHDPAFKRFAAMLLEKAAQVCEGMHEEDRPGDYAYALRAMSAALQSGDWSDGTGEGDMFDEDDDGSSD